MEPMVIPQRDDPYRPYRRVGAVLAACIVLVGCVEVIRNVLHPTSVDFLSFWGAGKLALGGAAASAYDAASLHALQIKVAAFDAGDMPYPYAPAFLLLLLPFALLPFPVAMGAWSAVTLPLYAVVARRFAPRSGWLAVAFPPVFVSIAIGQNAFLTAAAFLGGLTLLAHGRKVAAGMVLGCLILKPQLALMLPVAMLAAREWRVIAGAAISSLAILLIGLLVFGTAASVAWLAQMPLYMHIARDGLVGWHKLTSLYAAGRQAGLSETAAMVVHSAVALGAAGLVADIWRSDATPSAKAGVLGAATMLASPYVYMYDALMLLPAFVFLVERRAPVAVVGSLWLLPIAGILQAAWRNGPINIGPVVPIVLLLLCYRLGRAHSAAGSGRAGSTFGVDDGPIIPIGYESARP
ncbi:glycosyltransferase family 87 protein [Sphingomonas glacialis]|uniref:DUF2029 domain-containing protein n=1 Tax=Sphingomonas glacialis TaxID=658225 RepID=A0A502FHX7_9SPHN|nr:glycosyltransferase family 87 protein [Sphingomonas glacialis]TPG49070.1 DUF2029 domain-containing protein [Sphingomonas glacialis]